jgi:hypothetical protein
MRRFEFERWPRPSEGEVKVFIWRLAIGPHLLPDCAPVRVQEDSLPHDCRFMTSIWRPKTDEGLVHLDIYEQPSRQAAEMCLLDVLASFQSPLVRRDADAKYPLFRYGDDVTLVFTRGNLTFFAANAEREIVSLKSLLANIGRLFLDSPDQPDAKVIPVVQLGQTDDVRAGAAAPLTLASDYPLPVWYRIETKLGEVHREGSRLMYHAPTAGSETLNVTVTGADGRSARLERIFDVRDPD